jgi:hypothetical protein
MKNELKEEYESMLEKNKKDMDNMEAEFQKRLEEAKLTVSYLKNV